MKQFFNHDVIIVTSFVHRTESICVLISPLVIYHKLQVTNNTEKMLLF